MPDGVLGGSAVAVADVGGTLAATVITDKATIGAYTYSAGVWTALHGLYQNQLALGLSADGSSVLYADEMSGASAFVLSRSASTTRIESAPGMRVHSAALSSDNSTVFYSQSEQHTITSGTLHRWRDGVATTLATLPDRYSTPAQIVVGSLEETFVFNTDLRDDYYNVGGPRRAVIFDHGSLTEVPTLSSAAYTRSNAIAMSGDGSMIVGNETSWDEPGGWTYGNDRAWMVRDGVFSELSVEGYGYTQALGLSLDGSTMLVNVWNDPGMGGEMLLMYDDGRRLSVNDLFADAGLVLGDGVSVTTGVLSSDGQTLSGLVVRPNATGGADLSFYILTVPGPGGIGLLAGAGLLAARRR